MILTKKQEDFAFNVAIKGMTQHDAWIEAGYSHSYSDAVLNINACRAAQKTNVALRITELRDEQQAAVKSEKIADFGERQEILSDIAREKKQNSVHAIDVHNKMDKIYETSPVGYQDNRVINIIVMDKKTKELMEKVKDRTGKLIDSQDTIDN